MSNLTWDELAIRVICRAKSKREEAVLLKRLDDAAKAGRKSVKLPKHILGSK